MKITVLLLTWICALISLVGCTSDDEDKLIGIVHYPVAIYDDTSSPSVSGYAESGDTVDIIKREEGWYYAWIDGYMGYLNSDSVEIVKLSPDEKQQASVQRASNGVVVVNSVENDTVESVDATEREDTSFLSRCWDWITCIWVFKIIKWGVIILLGCMVVAILVALAQFVFTYIMWAVGCGLISGGITFVVLKLLEIFDVLPRGWTWTATEWMFGIGTVVGLIWNLGHLDKIWESAQQPVKYKPDSGPKKVTGNKYQVDPLQWVQVVDENGDGHELQGFESNGLYLGDDGETWHKFGDTYFRDSDHITAH